jgi:glycogen(starch) synthase
MKILMACYVFPPSVGGIETVSALLADELIRQGEDLRVITQTPAATEDVSRGYELIRRPSPKKLVEMVRWADVVLHMNISLRLGWPLLFVDKPWVISHHTSMLQGLRGTLKRRCAQRSHNISVSNRIAATLGTPSVVIHNAYDDKVFYPSTELSPDNDLIFVGRLVSEKGVDCALSALKQLQRKRVRPNFTIVGSGPEKTRLQQLSAELGLSEQVVFAGPKFGSDLANELRRHRLLVVPSLYEEPFGIVALEGIASGCVVVGSQGGGLKDAIGPCGMTFPNGDVAALAECLEALLSKHDARDTLRENGTAHLAQFNSAKLGQNYLAVMHSALASRSKVRLLNKEVTS